jgi:hypothetical protein
MHAIDRTAALPSLHIQVSRQQQRRVEAKKRGFGVSRFAVANRVISPFDCADQHAVPPRRCKATATTTLQSLSLSIDGSWCWISRPGPDKNVFVFGYFYSTESTDGFI